MVKRLPLVVLLLGSASAWAQNVISARSGMVNHVEGSVLLDGTTIQPKFGQFPAVGNGHTLVTKEGRAEVLLTPGVFLRLAENSSFRMISDRLSDTSLEVLSGEVLFEVSDLLKDNAVTVKYKDASVALEKHGLYRFDADSGTLEVYDGQARVTSGDKTMTAKKHKRVQLDAGLEAKNFDTKDTDAFYRWASRRSEYIATANVSAAHSAGASGFFSGGGLGVSSWAWNPWFGSFTYLPGAGYGYSPFGWAYYSPYTVGYLYSPFFSPYYNGGTYYPYGVAGGGGRTTTPVLAPERATPLNSGVIGGGSRGFSGGGGVSGGGFSAAATHSAGAGMSRGGGGGGGRGGR
jgi:FecR protein